MNLTRVDYREGQRLSTRDLQQEQSYRDALRRGHSVVLHGWGIVSGLRLAAGEEVLRIAAGLAVDGYGRELIVPQPLEVDLDVLDELFDNECRAVDVWLLYGRAPYTPRQRGRRQCGPGRHSRWREEARLRLMAVPDASVIDPRHPPGVPAADLESDLFSRLTEDPEREWPVYLGRVRRAGGDSAYAVAAAVLPYARLVGETIVAPSGQARMQLGKETGQPSHRFAIGPDDSEAWLSLDRAGDLGIPGQLTVYGDGERNSDLYLGVLRFTDSDLLDAAGIVRKLKSSDPPYSDLRAQLDEAVREGIRAYDHCQQPSPELRKMLVTGLNYLLTEVTLWNRDAFRTVRLRRETRTVIGQYEEYEPYEDKGLPQELVPRLNRLLLEDAFPGALARSRAASSDPPVVRFDALPELPEAAAPWQIYHAVVAEEEAENGETHDELRVELFHPGDAGEPANYQLVIGHRDGETFHPCLTVRADCTVVVNGRLRVEGQVAQGPIPLDPSDPRFNAAVLESWLSGTAAGSAALDCLYDPAPLELTVAAASGIQLGESLAYSLTVRNASSCPLQPVQVVGNLFVVRGDDDEVQYREPLSRAIDILEPSADQAFAFSFDPNSFPGIALGDSILITARAVSVGPLGNVISSDEAQARIAILSDIIDG